MQLQTWLTWSPFRKPRTGHQLTILKSQSRYEVIMTLPKITTPKFSSTNAEHSNLIQRFPMAFATENAPADADLRSVRSESQKHKKFNHITFQKKGKMTLQSPYSVKLLKILRVCVTIFRLKCCWSRSHNAQTQKSTLKKDGHPWAEGKER